MKSYFHIYHISLYIFQLKNLAKYDYISISPPAPWLQTDEIRHLQTERDRLRREVQKDGSTETWILFRAIRNKIKTVIGKAI